MSVLLISGPIIELWTLRYWFIYKGLSIQKKIGGKSMVINRAARAGTLESSDIYIMVKPNEDRGIEIQLDSIVLKQFGDQIENVIRETLKELEVENVLVIANDRGALDFTIKSRVETAIKRAI